MKAPRGVLETCLYVDDLDAARQFYATVLGALPFMEEAGRHIFLKMGGSLLFLFEPGATAQPTPPQVGISVPIHGARGPGHVAFAVEDLEELEEWRAHLGAMGVGIEQDIEWPNGARSLYFRDPAGNSLELATENLWRESVAAIGHQE